MEKEVRRALLAMTDTYAAGARIGSGSYGVVYEVFAVTDGAPFAAKFILPSTADDSFLSDDAIRELRATTTHAPCEYLVTFSRVLLFSNFVACFIMKRYDCTLAVLLKDAKLAHASVLSVFFQLVNALGVLHAAGTCHRDVKPENILVDLTTGGVVLADLGVAKNDVQAYHEGRRLTGEVATCGYAPIETLLPLGNYTTALDVWSLGVVFYEMLAGKKPFPVCTDRAAHAKVITGTHGVPPACVHCTADGGCLDTECCALNFLRNTCSQRVGSLAVMSRLPGTLAVHAAAAHAEGNADATACSALVLEMLQYIPGRRPTIKAVAESPVLAGYSTAPSSRTLVAEPRLHAAGAVATGAAKKTDLKPVLPFYTKLPLTVTWMFNPLQSPVDAALPGKWPGDGPEFTKRLLYLLDFYLHEHSETPWCVEAWLLAMETCRLLRNGGGGGEDTIERIAAYLQYGLALATPTQPDPPYCRYDWIVRIPVRVLDTYRVSREEARLVAELCGRAPRILPAAWMSAATKIRREFFEGTL